MSQSSTTSANTGVTAGATQNTQSASNSTLNGVLTQLFGAGGAGTTGVNGLTSIASGQNITQLNSALTASNSSTLKSGIGNLKEAFGASGMGSSSALAKVIGQTVNTNASNLTTNLASSDLTAQGQQLSASSYLSQILSTSADQYFNSGTTASGTTSSNGSTTSTPSGLGVATGLFGTLFGGVETAGDSGWL
jgi:hypothetical protein